MLSPAVLVVESIGRCIECRCYRCRLATSRPLGERSEPFLAAKRPTASDEGSDEGLFESLLQMQSLADHSTHLRATCHFPTRGLKKHYAARAKLKNDDFFGPF